jgi:hypothetical protein
MQAATTGRHFRLRLAAAAAIAAVVASGLVALDAPFAPRADRDRAPIMFDHVRTTADMDFAHRAFRMFRDRLPAPAAAAATSVRTGAARI